MEGARNRDGDAFMFVGVFALEIPFLGTSPVDHNCQFVTDRKVLPSSNIASDEEILKLISEDD